jgi:hypothetical protein
VLGLGGGPWRLPLLLPDLWNNQASDYLSRETSRYLSSYDMEVRKHTFLRRPTKLSGLGLHVLKNQSL